jgi:hypothetical protein
MGLFLIERAPGSPASSTESALEKIAGYRTNAPWEAFRGLRTKSIIELTESESQWKPRSAGLLRLCAGYRDFSI